MKAEESQASVIFFAEISWRKASRSANNGACVEVASWRKSLRSGDTGDCVEAGACRCCGVAVRDSKNPDGARLAFSATEWRTFIERVQRGRLELR